MASKEEEETAIRDGIATAGFLLGSGIVVKKEVNENNFLNESMKRYLINHPELLESFGLAYSNGKLKAAEREALKNK